MKRLKVISKEAHAIAKTEPSGLDSLFKYGVS
jgi:hypothetical protein